VYALGVLLFEVLTGQRPFRGDEVETISKGATTGERIRYAHLHLPPPDPRSLNPTLPPALSRIIARCMAKVPQDRYQSTAALLVDLQGLGIQANERAQFIPMRPAAVASAPNTEREEQGQRVPPKGATKAPETQSTSKWVWAGGAAVLGVGLCLALIIGVMVFSPNTLFPQAEQVLPTVIELAVETPSGNIPAATDTALAVVEIPNTDPLPSPTIPAIETTLSPTPLIAPIDSTIISPKDEATLVYIPAGEFRMGSNINDAQRFCQKYSTNCKVVEDEDPQHIIMLDEFWIDQYEVTNKQFEIFTTTTGYITDAEKDGKSKVWTNNGVDFINGADWRHPTGSTDGIVGLENHPVVQVSWNDAYAYCKWSGRRLPTEAEWEKSARGDLNIDFPWGSDFNCQYGNYDDETMIDNYTVSDKINCDNFSRTAPVGNFPLGASPYNVYDLSGNVWEWVADWYEKEYYSNSPSVNPLGPADGNNKVIRGGSWFSEMKFLYIPYRDGEENYPGNRDDILGFRCAQSVIP